MGIKVTWQNETIGEGGTNIYRSKDPIDELNPPAPIATVGPGITEYNDTSVPNNEVWFYRFGVMKEGVEHFSENESVYTSTYRGPGPQELIAGNFHDLGLFGILTQEELVTVDEIYAQIDIQKNYILNSLEWVKVFHDGKIKYISASYFISGNSWRDLYHAGLVFGTPGTHEDKIPAGVYSNLIPTDQGTAITKNGHVFSPRLLSMWSGEASWERENGANLEENLNSECGQIMNRLSGIQLEKYDWLYYRTLNLRSNNRYGIGQELSSDGRAITVRYSHNRVYDAITYINGNTNWSSGVYATLVLDLVPAQ